jgi:hypothetical protein
MMHDACGFMTHECTRSIWQGKVMHESRPKYRRAQPTKSRVQYPIRPGGTLNPADTAHNQPGRWQVNQALTAVGRMRFSEHASAHTPRPSEHQNRLGGHVHHHTKARATLATDQVRGTTLALLRVSLDWSTAMHKLRIVMLGTGLARGDRKWSLNDGHIPNTRVVRVHVSPGYNHGEGNRRASRNGRVRSPTRSTSRRSDSHLLHRCIWRGSAFRSGV